MINLNNVTLRRGRDILLEDLSLTVHARQRVGVVGRNGTGKSSLFALLLGQLGADRGEVQMPTGLTVATVSQENPAGTRAAIEYVIDGDTELRQLEANLTRAEADQNVTRQADIHERLNTIGGYAGRARAARLLHGLGFAPDTFDRPINSFSGGWRMRLNLAQALMCRSDLMLLDEPTNHLDLDAVLWLQEFLSRYPGTLLVISHDRDFLDAVAGQILHLEGKRGVLYTGNYSAFEVRRAEKLEQQQAQYENQAKRRAHLQAFVDRFRYKATKAKQAQSRLKQLERMETVAPAHWDSPFTFAFAEPKRLPTWLLRLDGAAAGYNNTPVVAGMKLTIAPGDRLALLGRNGAGKSTVMRLLAGEQPSLSEPVGRDRYLKVGYFAQHQLEQLDHQASALTHLQRMNPAATEQQLRNFLGGFDFHGDKALAPVAPFSGGEKARLALAMVVYTEPNLLLLDEPTNHLDLDMRQALERALQDFAGAVVLVAHDRHLIDATCDQLWRVADGRCEPFDGDLDDYARWLRAQQPNAEGGAAPAAPAEPEPARPSGREARQAAADQRAREKPLRNELKKLERELDRVTRQLDDLEKQLADPELYAPENRERAARLTTEQGRLRKTRDDIEQRWMDCASELEEA